MVSEPPTSTLGDSRGWHCFCPEKEAEQNVDLWTENSTPLLPLRELTYSETQ